MIMAYQKKREASVFIQIHLAVSVWASFTAFSKFLHFLNAMSERISVILTLSYLLYVYFLDAFFVLLYLNFLYDFSRSSWRVAIFAKNNVIEVQSQLKLHTNCCSSDPFVGSSIYLFTWASRGSKRTQSSLIALPYHSTDLGMSFHFSCFSFNLCSQHVPKNKIKFYSSFFSVMV